MNATRHRDTSPSRIERLIAGLTAGQRSISGPSSAQVDFIHDIHVVPISGDR